MFDSLKNNKPAQAQSTSENSIAMQAGGDIHSTTIVGPTIEQMHDVALTIFKDNFYQLAGLARDIANQRASEITEKFLEKLIKEYPHAYQKADDPDFQSSLFTVQREFAKSGDVNLGDLLIDLLVDRAKQNERDLVQIVLNESLSTAPKITSLQANILSLIFFFRYVTSTTILNFEQLSLHLNKFVSPLCLDLEKLKESTSTFQHLEFAGCGTASVMRTNLADTIKDKYGALFSSGFEELVLRDRKLDNAQDLCMPCMANPARLQFRTINTKVLADHLTTKGILEDRQRPYIDLFNQSLMSDEQVQAMIIGKNIYMKLIFDMWSSTQLSSFTLTSVGMAIGHANLKRLIGFDFAPLSIWVN